MEQAHQPASNNHINRYERLGTCRSMISGIGITILSGNAEIGTAGAMRVVIDVQNKLLLELHQLHRLTNLCAFWYFAISLDKGANFLASRHLCVNLILQQRRLAWLHTAAAIVTWALTHRVLIAKNP
jgi:hypothetical protein